MSLTRRSIHIPIQVELQEARRELLALARSLCAREMEEASSRARWLIARAEAAPSAASLASLRAAALASVLHDLAQNLWEFSLEPDGLYALAPRWHAADSSPETQRRRARESVSHARAEQLRRPAVRRFIRDMERGPRALGGVQALIADGAALRRALARDGVDAIRPYVQLARVCDGDDAHTGLRLYDCFRYLRYSWSFPCEDSPGRRIPLLVRDAGQPHHPICGLLCLSSPTPQLAARDAGFGWSAAWFEAVARALNALADHVSSSERLRELERALIASAGDAGTPSPSQLARDMSTLMDLRPRAQLHQLASPPDAARRLELATMRLVSGLLGRVRGELSLLEDIPTDYSVSIERLRARSQRARDRLAKARHDAARGAREEATYDLKRSRKVLRLTEALSALAPLEEARARGDGDALRAALLAAAGGGARFSRGERCARALLVALREHKVAALAANIAEVSVCGATPPYRPLLMGKLISLIAFSDEIRHVWEELYRGQVSVVQSRLIGEKFVRPSTLDGLVTTSYYPMHSAQYNRATLPAAMGGFGWRRVGLSEGHGTLHFTGETLRLIQRLLSRDEDLEVIWDDFSSGHSKRLRRLRRGLSALGLPAEALGAHGMRRNVYVCRFNERCLPGVEALTSGSAPLDDIVQHWRRRWLEPRLERAERIASTPKVFTLAPDDHPQREPRPSYRDQI